MIPAWAATEYGIELEQVRTCEGERVVLFLDPGRILPQAGVVRMLVGTKLITLTPTAVRMMRLALTDADNAMRPQGEG